MIDEVLKGEDSQSRIYKLPKSVVNCLVPADTGDVYGSALENNSDGAQRDTIKTLMSDLGVKRHAKLTPLTILFRCFPRDIWERIGDVGCGNDCEDHACIFR